MSVPKRHLDLQCTHDSPQTLGLSLMRLGADASFPSLLLAKIWTNLSPRFTQSFLEMVSPKQKSRGRSSDWLSVGHMLSSKLQRKLGK